MNKIFTTAYVFLSIIVLLSIVAGDLLAGLLPPTVDLETLAFITAVLMLISGFVVFPSSYKAVRYKLTPFALVIFWIVGDAVSSCLRPGLNGCSDDGWILLSVIAAFIAMFFYGSLLLIGVWITRRFFVKQ